jgi:hypothetical protein
MRTTTDALVKCRKSIRCKSGKIKEPAPDVYAQIMQMIQDGKIKGENGRSILFCNTNFNVQNNVNPIAGTYFSSKPNVGDLCITANGVLIEVTYMSNTNDEKQFMTTCKLVCMLKGEKGDKGDKGDAGSIKFIPVVELPTENIDESAIYLVPIENADGENRFTEYAYIDGKWEAIGGITIQVDHSEYVKFTDYATNKNAGVAIFDDYYGIGIYTAGMSKGYAYFVCATDSDITGKKNRYKPIVPYNQDKAWKMSAIDNKETWTDEDKAKACETIGAVKQEYVDNLPDHLTLTDEQKAKWRALLGIE